MSAGICTPECWTPTKCSHGDTMHPRGRSAPLGSHICCDESMNPSANARHLWDECDDERWRFDPRGRELHLTECDRCREEDQE